MTPPPFWKKLTFDFFFGPFPNSLIVLPNLINIIRHQSIFYHTKYSLHGEGLLSTATPGITVSLHHSDSVSLFHIIPVSINLLVWYYPGCCLPCQCSSCPCQAAGRSLPPFSCRNSQAVWSWHVRKINATSWGDWRIGNTKTSPTKGIHIALNPISVRPSSFTRTYPLWAWG